MPLTVINVLSLTRYNTGDIETVVRFWFLATQTYPPEHLTVSYYSPTEEVRTAFHADYGQALLVRFSCNGGQKKKRKRLKIVRPSALYGTDLEKLAGVGQETAPMDLIVQMCWRLGQLLRHRTDRSPARDDRRPTKLGRDAVLASLRLAATLSEQEGKKLRIRFALREPSKATKTWRAKVADQKQLLSANEWDRLVSAARLRKKAKEIAKAQTEHAVLLGAADEADEDHIDILLGLRALTENKP